MTALTKVMLLALVILITSARSVFNNSSCKSNPDDRRGVMRFMAICSFAALPVFLIVHLISNGGIDLSFSWFTAWTAAVFASLVLLDSVAALFALTCGPLSYSVLLARCGGLVISAVIGAVLWSEDPSILQFLGLFVLLTAMYLGANPKREKNITPKWLLLVGVSVLGGGFSGIMQKVHQSNELHKTEMTEFLVLTFIFMGIAALLVSFLFKPIESGMKFSLLSRDFRNSVLSGMGLGGVNLIILALAGELESMILFPVFNGSVVVLTAIASIVIFRERLSRRQVMGIVLGVVSIVLLVL